MLSRSSKLMVVFYPFRMRGARGKGRAATRPERPSHLNARVHTRVARNFGSVPNADASVRFRNGYRERSLVASVGDLKVRMPKLRTGPSSPKTSSSATAGWTARSWPRRRRCTCSASQVARSRRWRARWTSPQYRSGRCRVWTNAWTWRREMFRRQRFDGAKFAYL